MRAPTPIVASSVTAVLREPSLSQTGETSGRCADEVKRVTHHFVEADPQGCHDQSGHESNRDWFGNRMKERGGNWMR